MVVVGTGSVALFATRIAAAQGARVVVISGSGEKLERAKALGAADGISRLRHPQWAGMLRDLTDGCGADHVLELAGGDNFGHSLAAAAKGGRVSVIGNLAGDELRSSVHPLLQGAVTYRASASATAGRWPTSCEPSTGWASCRSSKGL
ncbi:MAG: zinc-binding dehydrogenase [Rhizobium sp.]